MHFILRDILYNQSMWEEVCCCFVVLLHRENAKDSLFHNDGVVFSCSENDAAERVDMLWLSGEKRER